VVGALADNNIILQDAPPIFKNFSLYVLAALALGTSKVIIARQRRSLALENPDDFSGYPKERAFLDASYVLEEFLVIIYQVLIFALLYNLRHQDPLFWVATVRSWVYYSIMPFQLAGTLLAAVVVQVLVCTIY